jgi:hypothetical protein
VETGGSQPTAADMETAVWRERIEGKLDRLIAEQEKTNGTLSDHSRRLDEFGLALARQIAINDEVERLRNENRLINAILAAATIVAGWFGLRR